MRRFYLFTSREQRTQDATLKEMRKQTAEMRQQTAILNGSVARDAMDALRKEQWRASKDPSAQNVRRLRAAEQRVRELGLQVSDLRR